MSSSISSGEWMWRWAWCGAPSRRRIASPLPFRNALNGLKMGHRHHRVDRGGRRVLQRERLRDELADQHLQDRQRDEDEAGGDRLRGDLLQAAEALEQRNERDRERGLGEGPEDQAGERDADLRDGDVTVQLSRRLDDRQQPSREPVALLREGPQAAAPHADGCKFGRHVESGRQDEDRRNEGGNDHASEVLNTARPRGPAELAGRPGPPSRE
jgi:hypothetical protein